MSDKNRLDVWYDEFAELDTEFDGVISGPDYSSVITVSAGSINNSSIIWSGSNISNITTNPNNMSITGSIVSNGLATIGLDTQNAKPGQVLTVDRNGEPVWCDIMDIVGAEIEENPALEGAMDQLFEAWQKYKMMKNLCKKDEDCS